MKKEKSINLDFANGAVWPLFRKIFYPTLLGMMSMVVLNMADGAFIGHGAGSDSLAAINIAAPIFNLMTGIGIMFGIGASIAASIHLSRGNTDDANRHVSHSFLGSIFFTVLLSALMLSNLDATCRLFGSNEELLPLASSYLRWIAIFMPFQMLGMVGGFIVRLDGSPKYAMCCTLVASCLNIFLDWLFIFPFQWGLEGAAIATSLSFSASALVVLYYVFFKARKLHLCPLGLFRGDHKLESARGIARNLGYQMKLGFPAMLGECAISGMIIVGNYIFVEYLGSDGVAAFSVACYCTPVFFMVANAIAEASQPIISYAYGAGNLPRLFSIRKVILNYATVSGLLSMLLLTVGSRLVTGLFLQPEDSAFAICIKGLPLFGISAFFVPVNLTLIGYFQSIEKSALATFFTLLRGFILVIPAFLLMPQFFGVTGIWLAVPVSETLTFAVLFARLKFGR